MRTSTGAGAGPPAAGAIVIIAPAPPPYGGMALQARALADRLSGEGIAAVLVPTNPLLPGPVAAVPAVRTVLQSLLFLFRLLRDLPRAAVVHILAASYFYFWARVAPAILLGRLFGKRVILNYRGGEAQRFLGAYGAIAVPLLRLATVVTVPSSFLKRTFAEHNLGVLTVPNLLDLDRFKYRRRGTLGPRLLVTRNLEPMYNVKMALLAYEIVSLQHPGASLDVLGSGSEEQALRGWVRERALDGVCFRGAVAHERVPEYLDRADILLNPTNVDNMPLTVLEAFASGVAVVTTDAGGIPDLIGDSGAALLVATDDAKGMAAMILELIADPVLAERTIAAARQVAEKYGWPDVRAALLQAYYPNVEFPTTSTAAESKPL